MKRRGFLGAIASIVAASALPKPVEAEPHIEVIDKVFTDKERPVRLLASGVMGYPENGALEFDRKTGLMKVYSEDHSQWFYIER
jgi:hypothetical protein